LAPAIFIHHCNDRCNSVKHSYHSGNFEKAVEKSVRKLKSNLKDDETILYLTAWYSKLYRESMDRITF
jgi:predicted 2-oxoglutarate/Fe(II)-dependent dioxygenase YbiX